MSGTVRDNTDGQPVNYLEYQAYEPMALQMFRQIGSQIQQRWSEIRSLVIYHRIGKLMVGEISVLVVVGCPHRGEAFEPVSMPSILSSIPPPSGRKNIGKMEPVPGSVLGL